MLLYSVLYYTLYIVSYYTIPRSAQATAWPRLAAAWPRTCREVWGTAKPPSEGSGEQRPSGNLNYFVNTKISILGVLLCSKLSIDERGNP